MDLAIHGMLNELHGEGFFDHIHKNLCTKARDIYLIALKLAGEDENGIVRGRVQNDGTFFARLISEGQIAIIKGSSKEKANYSIIFDVAEEDGPFVVHKDHYINCHFDMETNDAQMIYRDGEHRQRAALIVEGKHLAVQEHGPNDIFYNANDKFVAYQGKQVMLKDAEQYSKQLKEPIDNVLNEVIYKPAMKFGILESMVRNGF